jgi:choline dehydrogenase-like flavoprotein
MRGRPADYDDWQAQLHGTNDSPGWGWEKVLPHFRRMESNNRLNNNLHGTDGPMLVSDPGHIDQMSRWFVQAVQGLGEPFNPDFNGLGQRGVGFYQFMNRHGKRSSAAYAYVSPQENNPNLQIQLHAEVHRLIIENNKAVGVEYNDKHGKKQTVYAEREIIVTAGALITPKLLMLSGIGPAEHLRAHDIKVVADVPGVGQHLIDHPEVPITAHANGPYGYYKQGVGWRMLKNGLQFRLFGNGLITSAGVEAGAFVNPSDPTALPTIQAFCVPIVYLDRDSRDSLEDGYGLTITTVVVKPKSRGDVKLRSANPEDMPLVSPNLLKHPDDMREMIAGQRFFLRAFQTSPLAERIEKIAIPSPDNLTDEAMSAHCKRFVKTNYHPASTCRMGADGDPMAVLDARLRVRGIDNLRVSDMSAVPDINAGNTNAPAMMLGDRCADFLLNLQ